MNENGLNEEILKVEAKTEVDISVQDIISKLIEKKDHELLFETIVEIDALTEDWGFAEKCYKYFKSLKSLYERDCAKDTDFHDWDCVE